MIRQPTGSAEMCLGSVQALPPTKGVDLNPFLASPGFNAPHLLAVMTSEDGIYHCIFSLAERQAFQSSVPATADSCSDVPWE